LKHRVFITGMGIVSCIGNDLDNVTNALRRSCSGIRHMPEYQARGLRSHVAGIPDLAAEPPIERKLRRFMADAAVYGWHAMRKAIGHAGITPREIADPRTGLMVGSGVASPSRHDEALRIFEASGLDKLKPYFVPQIMGSTVSGNLAQAFGICGPSYSITAACATSAHCIGNAAELIRHGVLDRAFAGGAEEVSWNLNVLFDAMGTLSTRWNAEPARASRPFDRARDGFVIAGGAGILLLESEASARAAGRRPLAELAGYGACSSPRDMVYPDSDAIAAAIRAALADAGEPRIDYINPHATSTPSGDGAELDAIAHAFPQGIPPIAATKGLTGHSIGAISAQEAILSVLMMQHGFIAASANLEQPDPGYEHFPIVRAATPAAIEAALSVSIGFGGTNVALVLRNADGAL
jgi:3-oxoacyl-[acyl-carrier-protein] synthase-1